MRISISYIGQVVDGWAQKAMRDIMAAVTTGYHTQHNTDDTHGTISATGSISERKRTVPLGNWTDQVFATTDFTAVPAGSMWTLRTSTLVKVFAYTLIGRTLYVTFDIEGSMLAGAPATALIIALPIHAQLNKLAWGTFAYNDNGTTGIGVIRADPVLGNALRLQKDVLGAGTFSTSGNLTVAGQIAVEAKETV